MKPHKTKPAVRAVLNRMLNANHMLSND